MVCCYSWQYCINKVRDYPNTGLVAVVAHDYAKNHFHPQHMRRVRDFCCGIHFSFVGLCLKWRFLTSNGLN